MLLLRGARAASAWAASTAVAAGASGCRYISIRLAPVAALSSGGRKRKGQRRGEAKPPSPPPPPQPLPRQSETPSSKKKSGARPSGEAKKSRPVELGEARGPRRLEGGEARKGNTQQLLQEKAKVKRLVRWKCASGCGACCKLDKGPDFPTPDEIFADHQDDLQVQLYRSMIGSDGWCINYDKATRTCNIYQDRPSFCRVEPKVFDEFFGVPHSRFDREACSACVDNIKMVYGDDSSELSNFKRVIREESNKLESKNQDKLLDT